MSLFIGLMSGTSLDGVDGVLAELDGHAADRTAIRVRAHHQAGFSDALRAQLLHLQLQRHLRSWLLRSCR